MADNEENQESEETSEIAPTPDAAEQAPDRKSVV